MVDHDIELDARRDGTGERRPSDLMERFHHYRRTGDRSVRNELVERHAGLAEFHASRFASPVAALDDLRQVALLGMVGAVERFDPDVGVAFQTFASRTVEGECKRYVRDRTWAVRPPRAQQEHYLLLRRLQEELTQRLGRPPLVSELAEAAGESEDEVLHGLEVGRSRSGVPITGPSSSGDDEEPAVEPVDGRSDAGYADVEIRLTLGPLVSQLPERDREMLLLRFVERWTESQIADHLSLSQSYVSRCLRRILRDLRSRLDV